MNGAEYGALAIVLVAIVVAYHYGITRDVRRTLHRVAEALEDLSASELGEEPPHVQEGGSAGH